MYQLWKFIRKNPGIYYPRLFAGVFISYISIGMYQQLYWAKFRHADVKFESHSGSYVEEKRVYGERTALRTKELILELRRQQVQKLQKELDQEYQVSA